MKSINEISVSGFTLLESFECHAYYFIDSSVVNVFECLNAVHIAAAAASCVLRYVLLGVRRESPKLLISVKRVVYFFIIISTFFFLSSQKM